MRLDRIVAALGLAAVLLPIPSHGAFNVSPPPASICTAGSSTGTAPGSTPATPGRWWNDKRPGTSWDLFFSDDQNTLTVLWYTYDQQRRPTWLISDTLAVQNTNPKTYTAQLYKFTWNYAPNPPDPANPGGSVNPGTYVGSVALTFLPNDPTKAAISWQWDVADQQVHSECIVDYFRPGPNATSVPAAMAAPEPNATYSGAWFEPSKSGWGLSVSIGLQTYARPSSYIEFDVATIYDSFGYPIWLLSLSASLTTPPPALWDWWDC